MLRRVRNNSAIPHTMRFDAANAMSGIAHTSWCGFGDAPILVDLGTTTSESCNRMACRRERSPSNSEEGRARVLPAAVGPEGPCDGHEVAPAVSFSAVPDEMDTLCGFASSRIGMSTVRTPFS